LLNLAQAIATSDASNTHLRAYYKISLPKANVTLTVPTIAAIEACKEIKVQPSTLILIKNACSMNEFLFMITFPHPVTRSKSKSAVVRLFSAMTGGKPIQIAAAGINATISHNYGQVI